MGLDTTHDCWHGAYSAFMRWRREIAACIGIDLYRMEGFWDESLWGLWGFEKDKLSPTLRDATHRRLFDRQLKWEGCVDPLKNLLYHSDCDGSIPSEQCGPIADRLEAILPLLPNGDAPGHIGNWRDKTQQFIDGLRLAASRGEDVEFH